MRLKVSVGLAWTYMHVTVTLQVPANTQHVLGNSGQSMDLETADLPTWRNEIPTHIGFVDVRAALGFCLLADVSPLHNSTGDWLIGR